MKIGDLKLNKIYCMDAIEFLKQLPSDSVDLVLTDPPYNTGMVNNKSGGWLSNFFNDSYSYDDYNKLVSSVCKEFYRVLKENKATYIYI